MFRDVIHHAAMMAKPYSGKNAKKEQKYFILLIIADGCINDMQETIDELVRASDFPLSVIIIGVGDDDFSLMDELDADDHPLYSKTDKRYMSRDIVQFVPFNDYKDKTYHELAMATLDEIPREVVNYFTREQVPPLKAAGALRAISKASDEDKPK